MDNKIIPLVNDVFKKNISDKIPSDIQRKIKNFSYQNQVRNLYILAVLSSLVSLLKNNEIDTIPFKGLITAHGIYGDIGLRSFSDIDLLVKKKDISKAWGVLCSNGFNPELDLDYQQLQKYIKTEDNILFINKKNQIAVELHWEMTGIYLPHPLCYESVQYRIHEITIHGKEFNNLSREDQLVYLCIHGAKHEWENIEQISSVAELIKTNSDLDWHLIENLAMKWRCFNLVLLGLYLSMLLFHRSLPKKIEQKINSNKTIKKLGDDVLSNMVNQSFGRRHNVSRISGFHIKNKDQLIDKLRYLFRMIFCPTKKDWLLFPVHANFSFIHYIYRPMRLILNKIITKNA